VLFRAVSVSVVLLGAAFFAGVFFAAAFFVVGCFAAAFLAFDFFAEAEPAGGGGILVPSRRASESPIAIACFGLVTFWPLPERSLPSFISFISCSTSSCAFGPYLAMASSPRLT